MKITRIWHGATKARYADEYLKYVENTGLKGFKKVKVNLSVNY